MSNFWKALKHASTYVVLYVLISWISGVCEAKTTQTHARLNNSAMNMHYILNMNFPLCVLRFCCGTRWNYSGGVGRTVALPTHWERHVSEELTVTPNWMFRSIHMLQRDAEDAICFSNFTVLTTHFQTEQAQHMELHRPAFVTSSACCSLPAIFPTLISALSLPLVLSLLPTLRPICLIFTISVQPLPPIVSSIFFSVANSPIFLPHWKGEHMFHQSTLCLALSN